MKDWSTTWNLIPLIQIVSNLFDLRGKSGLNIGAIKWGPWFRKHGRVPSTMDKCDEVNYRVPFWWIHSGWLPQPKSSLARRQPTPVFKQFYKPAPNATGTNWPITWQPETDWMCSNILHCGDTDAVWLYCRNIVLLFSLLVLLVEGDMDSNGETDSDQTDRSVLIVVCLMGHFLIYSCWNWSHAHR